MIAGHLAGIAASAPRPAAAEVGDVVERTEHVRIRDRSGQAVPRIAGAVRSNADHPLGAGGVGQDLRRHWRRVGREQQPSAGFAADDRERRAATGDRRADQRDRPRARLEGRDAGTADGDQDLAVVVVGVGNGRGHFHTPARRLNRARGIARIDGHGGRTSRTRHIHAIRVAARIPDFELAALERAAVGVGRGNGESDADAAALRDGARRADGIGGFVAGRSDEDHAGLTRVGQGRLVIRRPVAGAEVRSEAQVDDQRPSQCCRLRLHVGDGVEDRRVGTAGAEGVGDQQVGVGRHADHPVRNLPVARGLPVAGRDAAHVRAVAAAGRLRACGRVAADRGVEHGGRAFTAVRLPGRRAAGSATRALIPQSKESRAAVRMAEVAMAEIQAVVDDADDDALARAPGPVRRSAGAHGVGAGGRHADVEARLLLPGAFDGHHARQRGDGGEFADRDVDGGDVAQHRAHDGALRADRVEASVEAEDRLDQGLSLTRLDAQQLGRDGLVDALLHDGAQRGIEFGGCRGGRRCCGQDPSYCKCGQYCRE